MFSHTDAHSSKTCIGLGQLRILNSNIGVSGCLCICAKSILFLFIYFFNMFAREEMKSSMDVIL